MLELDAQPQYGVAELVFTADPEPTEYTISQLVPHVRSRRSSVDCWTTKPGGVMALALVTT